MTETVNCVCALYPSGTVDAACSCYNSLGWPTDPAFVNQVVFCVQGLSPSAPHAQATTTLGSPTCTGKTYTHEVELGVETGFKVGPIAMGVSLKTTLPVDTWYTWSCTVDWGIVATGWGGVARTVWAIAYYEDCGTNVAATTPAGSAGPGMLLTQPCPLKDHRQAACGYDGLAANGCANPSVYVGTSSFSGHGNVLGAATQAPMSVNLCVEPENAQAWNEMNPYTGLGTVVANASNHPCTPATISYT
ncbi:MAG: hypothetical protein V4510_04810 [bacterium]